MKSAAYNQAVQEELARRRDRIQADLAARRARREAAKVTPSDSQPTGSTPSVAP